MHIHTHREGIGLMRSTDANLYAQLHKREIKFLSHLLSDLLEKVLFVDIESFFTMERKKICRSCSQVEIFLSPIPVGENQKVSNIHTYLNNRLDAYHVKENLRSFEKKKLEWTMIQKFLSTRK